MRISAVQDEIFRLYSKGDWERAERLVRVRINFIKIVYEGDLGEDHAGMFIKDHPNVKSITEAQMKTLPFYEFILEVLRVDNPYILMGIMARNEAGSLAEAGALVETRLIKSDGGYGKLHLAEEVRHGELANELSDILTAEKLFRDDFHAGLVLHDELYATVLR